MANSRDTQLDDQIRQLRHEIARLSAILAVRKMESGHPAFHKLVDELTRAEESVREIGPELSGLGSRIATHIKNCPYRPIVGRILLFGILGYGISLALDWLISGRD